MVYKLIMHIHPASSDFQKDVNVIIIIINGN